MTGNEERPDASAQDTTPDAGSGMDQGLPDDARLMLGMLGFKIIVNTHGEVVNLEMPGQELDED